MKMADIDSGTEVDNKLNTNFPGKVVRKDLTKLMKVGHNVPVRLSQNSLL